MINRSALSKTALLCATALVSATAAPAMAQSVIESGATETIDPVNSGTIGSPWNVGGDLTVGRTGTGALDILQGGQATATNVRIGHSDNGRITMRQASSLTVNGELNIRNGALDVGDGSTVVSQTATLGDNVNDFGVIGVSGANSNWTNSGAMVIGDEDTGVVSVFDNGSVDSNGVLLGAFASASNGRRGEINLRTGGEWRNTGDMTVGDLGDGVMTIEAGSSLTSSGVMVLGAQTGGAGFVTIDDGALNNTGAVTVGGTGSGTLTLTGANASLTSNLFTIGDDAGSSGAVTVENGATLTTVGLNEAIVVGDEGEGTLTIRTGGLVEADGDVLISPNAGADGALIVDGGSLNAFDPGAFRAVVHVNGGARSDGARFIVRNAGEVTAEGLGVGSDGSGVSTDGGVALVSGAGSFIDVSGRIDVGYNDVVTNAGNHGRLTIENGGRVQGGSLVLVDGFMDPAGQNRTGIHVDGAGSELETGNTITIGQHSEGELLITNGGGVSSGDAVVIGDDLTHNSDNSLGVVLIDGEGSYLTSLDAIVVGGQGDGVLTVSNGGRVLATATNAVTLGQDAGSSGVLNIGAAQGETAVGAGVINPQDIAIVDGDVQIVFNHTDTDYAFSQDLVSNRANTNPGDSTHRIDIYAGATTMTGTWNIDGVTTVHGGRLNVNGEILSALEANGGVVGGAGQISALSVGAGGALSPGNSIGVITIANDLDFGDGSSLEIEVNDAGASDLVDVGGAVTIGNNVGLVVLPENGTDDGSTYNESTEYTFIQAAGGITGEFASITEEFAFLAAEVSIENGEAVLTLTRDAPPFEEVAISPNQRSIARSLEALGSGSELYDVVVGLSEEQARNAFDQLSGEIHASALTSVVQDSTIINGVAIDRLRNAQDDEGVSVWGAAYGSWGTWDGSGDNTAAELDRSTLGLTFGADFSLFERVRIGALVGVGDNDIEIDARGSEASIGTVHFGAYADWDAFKALTLRAGILKSWNSLETDRAVDIRGFNAFSDRLTADYNANVFQLFAEAGYAFDLGRFNVEPYAGLAYTSLDADQVTESGGSARLVGAEYDMDTAFSTLGMRADYAFQLFGANAALEGGLAWRHAFDDTLPRQTFGFVGATGGQTFTTEGVPLAEDAAVIDLGLSLPLAKRLGARLGYNGQFGDGVSDHGIRANVSFAF